MTIGAELPKSHNNRRSERSTSSCTDRSQGKLGNGCYSAEDQVPGCAGQSRLLRESCGKIPCVSKADCSPVLSQEKPSRDSSLLPTGFSRVCLFHCLLPDCDRKTCYQFRQPASDERTLPGSRRHKALSVRRRMARWRYVLMALNKPSQRPTLLSNPEGSESLPES
jgi:hypothetical protein